MASRLPEIYLDSSALRLLALEARANPRVARELGRKALLVIEPVTIFELLKPSSPKADSQNCAVYIAENIGWLMMPPGEVMLCEAVGGRRLEQYRIPLHYFGNLLKVVHGVAAGNSSAIGAEFEARILDEKLAEEERMMPWAEGRKGSEWIKRIRDHEKPAWDSPEGREPIGTLILDLMIRTARVPRERAVSVLGAVYDSVVTDGARFPLLTGLVRANVLQNWLLTKGSVRNLNDVRIASRSFCFDLTFTRDRDLVKRGLRWLSPTRWSFLEDTDCHERVLANALNRQST